MQTKEDISLQSGRGKADVDSTPKNNSDNNICSCLISAPDSIDLLLPRSSRSLHPGDMESSLGPLAKVVKLPFASRLNGSENFMNKRIAKVHEHIVCVFCKLGSIGNKKGAYMTASSKEYTAGKAWPEQYQAKRENQIP